MAGAAPSARSGPRYFKRVLGLFFAAAFIPVLILSVAFAAIAQAALARAWQEQGMAAADAFSAGFRTRTEGIDASLALIAASPEAGLALAGGNGPSPGRPIDDDAAAALGRLLAREASRQEGLALALVSASGGKGFGTRTLPADWVPSVYRDWGVFRKARQAAGMVLDARRRVTERGDAALIVAARPLRGANGDIEGYALAELDRSALMRTARDSGFGLASDFELRAPSGLVAFCLSDPGREGRFADELPGRTGSVFSSDSAGGFQVEAFLPSNLEGGYRRAMRDAVLLGMALCTAVALGLAWAASRIVTGPVIALSGAMRRLREGDLSVRLEPSSQDELGDLLLAFNATSEELDRLMRATIEDQALLRGAELRTLAAQMNPHFLYNSLNSIRSLARLGRNKEIVEVVTRLGKLLRASAEARAEVSTVGAGLELVRHYLAVEKIRYGDRFVFEEDVDEAVLDCELPSLVLEPLAENALTHGLERKRGPGLLRIEGRTDGRDVLIVVEDDGPGAEPALLAGLETRLREGAAPEGGGLGLAATNRRLRLRYGEGYGLRVMPGSRSVANSPPAEGPSDDCAGFRVELRVPLLGASA